MTFDLHIHTTASDGLLGADELVRLACRRGVSVLSITDHDTVAAYDVLDPSLLAAIRIVPGIELSTTWRGRGVHVVGLGIDPSDKTLAAGIAKQQAAREKRAENIARRLAAAGAGNLLDAAQAHAGSGGIGRPHFARALVDAGTVKDLKAAFRRFLGAGKTGDVRAGWASMPDVIAWIRASGGRAVLAHPAKYRLTATKLRELVADFRRAGGDAIEVCCGSQVPAVTARLRDIAADAGMAGSAGSDFHGPETSWSAPGRYAPLPSGLEMVWDEWPTD